MKLGIVTDSTCDLPGNVIEEHGIEVVPCILILDGKESLDGEGITRDEFYRRLPGFREAPTTATPSIGEFSKRYRKLLDAGCEHVLSIHAAGALTSILGTAQQAAAEFAGCVTALDSRSLSLGLGFQVLAAAEAAEQGLEAARAAVESTRSRVNVFAALDTLEYVRRSGRAPAAITAVGTLLSVKPLIELADAQVKITGLVRTTKQANQRMLGFLRQCGKLDRLAILHTAAEGRAREFLQSVMMEMNRSMPHEILLVNVTTVIGTHVGPNGLGFAAVKAGE
jgi:DegV family protein with EDD domain